VTYLFINLVNRSIPEKYAYTSGISQLNTVSRLKIMKGDKGEPLESKCNTSGLGLASTDLK
jgi:hypothetical protein